MIDYLRYISAQFWADTRGVALSEYLVALGILVGGVVATVLVFGNSLGIAWLNWASWVANSAPQPT